MSDFDKSHVHTGIMPHEIAGEKFGQEGPTTLCNPIIPCYCVMAAMIVHRKESFEPKEPAHHLFSPHRVEDIQGREAGSFGTYTSPTQIL